MHRRFIVQRLGQVAVVGRVYQPNGSYRASLRDHASLLYHSNLPSSGRLALRTFSSSTTTFPPSTTTTPGNVPLWPPSRSQMAKMAQQDDFDEANSGERRAKIINHEGREGGDIEYMDDHHFVPSNASSHASLSPHHDGYEDTKTSQRVDIYRMRSEQVRGAEQGAVERAGGGGEGFHGVSSEDEDMDWSAKVCADPSSPPHADIAASSSLPSSSKTLENTPPPSSSSSTSS